MARTAVTLNVLMRSTAGISTATLFVPVTTKSKRLGEAMCQAYRSEKGVEAVVARIARVYGPTLLPDDSKALSQFIHRSLVGEDVVLKSEGDAKFSYLHVADAVSGLLHILLLGNDGEAYNLADKGSDVMLRDLAGLIAKASGVKVVFELPDAREAAGGTLRPRLR